jgi:hypothetical protein
MAAPVPEIMDTLSHGSITNSPALRFTATRTKSSQSALSSSMSLASARTFTTSYSSNCRLKTQLSSKLVTSSTHYIGSAKAARKMQFLCCSSVFLGGPHRKHCSQQFSVLFCKESELNLFSYTADGWNLRWHIGQCIWVSWRLWWPVSSLSWWSGYSEEESHCLTVFPYWKG